MEELKFEPTDLLCGGVPCQSFSYAGKRKGFDDDRGSLLLKFIEKIHEVKPKMFMIENVKGLLSHDDEKTFKKILQKLSKDDTYDIKYKLLDTADFSVPQRRERVIIVGVMKKYKVKFKFPKKDDEEIPLSVALKDVPKSEGMKYSEQKEKLFKLIPQGGCWVNLPENLQKEYLGESYTSGGGKRGILRRLSMDKPSLTLLCSPVQKQTERCHPTEIRPLTIRESARIQTFPDTYEFIGSIGSQYKQIGNAVPVLFAYKLGKAIVKCLNKCHLKEYEEIIRDKVNNVLSSPNKEHEFDDILLDNYIRTHKEEMKTILKFKQLQMKIGKIWQMAIGNYYGFEDLGIGHKTGLDVKNKSRKIIMEIKNRHNTDNSSSRKSNLDKLAKYKKKHPDYDCIYGVINSKDAEGEDKIIVHDGVNIHYCSGKCLQKLIFGKNKHKIKKLIASLIKL